MDYADHHHGQTRLQVATLVRVDSAQTETTALLQQVITMLQQSPVRQRSRTLSMHSQVEPAGFNNRTTRVSYHPRLSVHTNRYHSQVVADPNTSTVTFSILSPDASLAYDRIKLRLEEYRTLLASDSDTIEFSTENGKTNISREQANEIGEYLDRSKNLLRDVIQSHDVPTLVVLQLLRDLSRDLDQLELYDECLLTGNCAIDFAEALGQRLPEFGHEQAVTLALIAELHVYEPRARTLFIQAVSLLEEVVANDASHSNKHNLFNVLRRAGTFIEDHLGTQWLERAIQLMTEELPPTMVDPLSRVLIYFRYGGRLYLLDRFSDALEAYREAISILRTLVDTTQGMEKTLLQCTLLDMARMLYHLGKYDEATVACKEALEICTTIFPENPINYKMQMAYALFWYGLTLEKLNQDSGAAVVKKQAVSIYRDLAQTIEIYMFPFALSSYARSCSLLGQHAEAVLVYQECIPMLRDCTAPDHHAETDLTLSLHDIALSLYALDRRADANDAADEALDRSCGMVFTSCRYAPGYKACFVCRRGETPSSSRHVSLILLLSCTFFLAMATHGILSWS